MNVREENTSGHSIFLSAKARQEGFLREILLANKPSSIMLICWLLARRLR
jgi:hypothetical protein